MADEVLELMERAYRENWTELDLSGLGLTTLPPEIGKLHKLLGLNLGGNQLISIPPEIGKLNKLLGLNLGGNQLVSIPPEIGELQNLQKLALWGNQLTTIPPEIGRIQNLQKLVLWGNQLISIPPEIGNLQNLKELDLGSNQLTNLPLEIGKLKNLQKLSLNNNRLMILPQEIGHLQNLQTLCLENNQLTTLPLEIGNLQKLWLLNLYENQFTMLSVEMEKLKNLEFLELHGNPFGVGIPRENLDKNDSPQTIINYYLEHKKGKEEGKIRSINEAKLILVGQGGVGKTSLVNMLLYDKFNPDETKTPGIAINKWHLDVDGEDIQLNIWDFGGQEIMHATHQFFMTKRSVYIIVLDARQGENEGRLEYWLRLIKSYGADSPIIVVCNKCEQHKIDLNWTGLKNKYPNIKGFVKEMSCKTGAGIDEAKELIKKATAGLDHIYDQLLNTWFEVKENLENMRKNFEADFLPCSDYHKLCKDKKIDSEISRKTLLGFLHDLGIVLCYQDDPRLELMFVLNPQWVTEGVYQVLNSHELFHTKGVLEVGTLHTILNRLNKPGEERYPRDKHLFIIDMMRKFELCFDFVETRDTKFLIPDLLSRDEPYAGEWNDSLAFQYHYDVLPPSVISRFIVRMHKNISKSTYWRTGVVLMDGGNKALVKADIVDRKIFISVIGSQNTRRDFLSKIRGQFESIHGTITGIKAEEKVPIPGHPEAPPISYQFLLRLEQKGIERYIFPNVEDEIRVPRLLDSIESKAKHLSNFNRENDEYEGRVNMVKRRKPSTSIEDNQPARLKWNREKAEEELQKQIFKGKEILKIKIDNLNEFETAKKELNSWITYNKQLFTVMFDSQEIKNKFEYAFGHPISMQVGSRSWHEEKKDLLKELSEKIDFLGDLKKTLHLFEHSVSLESNIENIRVDSLKSSNKVFIIHGRDETVKYKVANFLRKIELTPTILHEEANLGKTIIEKFESHASEVGYAIGILTGDDVGGLNSDNPELKPRARQNVILESGYFMGLLGRDKVSLLYENGVDLPSDLFGIVYISIDANDAWQLSLAKNMRAAGIQIDMNKVI